MSKTRLDHDDRINLQAGIAKGYSLRIISKILNKSRSTIYREIINNSYYKDSRHTCAHCKLNCKNKDHYKNGECQIFIAYECKHWKKFPYTCNKCNESHFCSNRKRYYDCVDAHAKAKRKRKEPRTFKKINDDDLKQIDSIVSDGVKRGQSLHHIYVANYALLSKICSERTIRRYVYHNYLSVKAHELPRYVRYSHKYDYKKKKIINVERMLGRTFSDYKKYVESHPDDNIFQYDSVEGKIDDKKAILTITYPEFRFQFGYFISKQNMMSVYKRMRNLQKLLGKRYEEIFQINLSDNGPEFSKFHEIETDKYGRNLCKVFFTNPYRSTDKASCERNHEFIRYVIPKGKSLDFLTQEKVELLFSHINSYVRESNKNKTPYDLMVERFGIEFMEIIGIKRIPPKDICLKPSLLR